MPSTSTSPGSVTAPAPRTSVAPCFASQSAWLVSSFPATWSRHQNTRAASTADTASAAPGASRARASASSGRRSVFEGMQAQYEHSPPTSSGSTTVTSASGSSRRSVATKASPVTPAPSTTTLLAI